MLSLERSYLRLQATNRDISEKIALGLAKPTMSKESMLDSRPLNQESLSNSFGDEESYSLYDRPLFHGSLLLQPSTNRVAISRGNDESFGAGRRRALAKP